MILNRQAIKADARANFTKNYWPVVGITVLVGLITGLAGCIPYIGYIASIAAVPVIAVGLSYYYLKTFRGEQTSFADVFKGFSSEYGHVLGGYWYMQLFIFLWSLLFVIPGIIKGIAYSMTPYILLDQPNISATDALKESMRLTDGHKWEIFVFYLSFLGWLILSSLTLGILQIFYVGPYMSTSLAGIYEALKEEKGTATYVEM